jgi:PPK2 family polyphosphate:nucleotide phosphotransferase
MSKAKKKSGDEPAIASAGALAGLLRVGPEFELSAVDPRSTPGFTAGKAAAEQALAADAEQLSQLQERLFAAARGGDGKRSLLLVVQGMDTSGKGGIVRHVVGSVDPQGVSHTAFKAPTPSELSHDFLWRIRSQVPEPGMLGVFDRSHYEDVLIVRVHNLVPAAVWESRYAAINGFEGALAQQGTAIVKVMLHISPAEQLARLGERLVRPDKYWKYNPADVTEHGSWAGYQEAYQAALTRCSTGFAPWFVVPADRKWYARWAVQQLLIDALSRIDPQWPPASFELDLERQRLAALMKTEDVEVPEDFGVAPRRSS